MSARDDCIPPAPSAAHAADDEVLHQNERTLISRRRLPDGRTVIDKQALGADAQQRLKHEAGVLDHLADVPGVVKRVLDAALPGALCFADDGSTALSKRLGAERLDTPTVLSIAIDLAHTLAAVHRAGVIHKDINPSNILLPPQGGKPVLIDFNIASRFAEERPVFSHQNHIAGTLAYMAPEQTGRTGRPVDQRSDLYALGVTLYEMATGRKPFESNDLLELVHDHLAHVPTPPVRLDPTVTPMLSAIIMKLLEKEADRRYQSAEGLAHDLIRLRDALSRQTVESFDLGSLDFPLRLTPPSHLVGRDVEIRCLETAIDKSITGENRAVLVAGAPGVGKSALLAEIQPMVTQRHGWFVSGKFDQYNHEAVSAIIHALSALGRLALAEPEASLGVLRERIRDTLGANLGLGPCLLPEFSLLLGPMSQPRVDDPHEAETRVVQATIDLLRAVAMPERPVVMVIDDLQWAPELSLRFVDMLLTQEHPIKGFLFIGTYRSSEVDAAHPLGALLARWEQLGVAPPSMILDNLPPQDTSRLVADMLRMSAQRAAPLGLAVSERTGGNPYDTVELINALRHDGLLAVEQGQWHWDETAIRHYVGDCDVVGLLQQRIDRLPAEAVTMMEIMSMLGGEASSSLLAVAAQQDVDAVLDAVHAPLEDGLLVIDNADDRRLRFRHDRVQQALVERMAAAARAPRHLALARRLSASPKFSGLAAQQYLLALPELQDADECRKVATLFARAAAVHRVVNYAAAERFLAAAVQLMLAHERAQDAASVFKLLSERHAALYGLARLDDADALYDALAARCTDPMQLVDVACVQIASLSARRRHKDAVALGLALLKELGLDTPADLRMAIGTGLFKMAGWIGSPAMADDASRAELSDPRLVALSKLLTKTQVAAFFCNAKVGAWLTMEAHRLWVDHGPCPPLMATLSCAPMQLIAIAQDYRGAYTIARHLVEVGEARGYQPATSFARFLHCNSAMHWFEPLEDELAQFHQAREGLLQGGELQNAAFTYQTWVLLMETSPTLNACADDIEAGNAMCVRTGDKNFLAAHRPARQLVKALRGDRGAQDVPGSFDDAEFSEAAHERDMADMPSAAGYFHAERALSAVIFNDTERLVRHAEAAMQVSARLPGYYVVTWIHLLQGLALAERARKASAEDREPLLKAFDDCLKWMRQRAADAPTNFLHLQRWLEAERAWICADAWAATTGFEAAMDEARVRSRPWHLALITERAAQFHRAQGLDHSGRPLLVEACRLYRAWGASAKVKQLFTDHPFVRTALTTGRVDTQTRSTMVSGDAVDVISVLRASQALSSETQLDRLNVRLGKVLSAMTGATSVLLVVRDEDGRGWSVMHASEEAHPALPLDDAVARGLLPLTAFRYAERTREPLLLSEAGRDERFARDPYFQELPQCSMLLVPVLSHGQLRAVLVLENRLSRGAFSADRLDAVSMIAGQLSVSIDNALLYASLERKVAERTAALEEANRRLEQISITDALTGLANRRRFNEAFEAEWLRARRAGTALGLAMIDVDHFKLYNDHYGHQGGDRCLRLVADAMKQGLRAGGDLVARYGGEEFVLLLPHADLKGTQTVAERVRAAVESLREPHEKSAHGIVTVSIGIVSIVPEGGLTPERFIEMADAALYEAKRQGRNRVGLPELATTQAL